MLRNTARSTVVLYSMLLAQQEGKRLDARSKRRDASQRAMLRITVDLPNALLRCKNAGDIELGGA
jgi:hypothetical protein